MLFNICVKSIMKLPNNARSYMHQGAGTITWNAYICKYWQVQSQDRLVCSYDETGRTSFAASNNSPAETSQWKLSKAARVPATCYKIEKAALVYAGPIGNADHTPVYFDMPSNITINEKGVKSFNWRNGQREGENYRYVRFSRRWT
jgi:hypothetical protein